MQQLPIYRGKDDLLEVQLVFMIMDAEPFSILSPPHSGVSYMFVVDSFRRPNMQFVSRDRQITMNSYHRLDVVDS